MAVAEAAAPPTPRLWPPIALYVALLCAEGALTDAYRAGLRFTGDAQCLRDPAVVSALVVGMYSASVFVEVLLVMLVFANAWTQASFSRGERLCLAMIALNCVALGGSVRILSRQFFVVEALVPSGVAGVLAAATASYIVQRTSTPTLLRAAPDFDFGMAACVAVLGSLSGLAMLEIRSDWSLGVAWAAIISACAVVGWARAPRASAHSAVGAPSETTNFHVVVFALYFFVLCAWFEMLAADCVRFGTTLMSTLMLAFVGMHALSTETWGARRYLTAYDGTPMPAKMGSRV